jgi:hypothetical protein
VLVGMKWVLASIGTILVLGLVFGVLGFVLGWYRADTDVVSPQNVKAQYQDAYTNFEALKATAGDVCSALAAIDAETDPDARSQRVSEELAYEQNYRRIAADYDAAYDNVFQAEHVGPADLPHTAPGLDAELTTVGCRRGVRAGG